uniref:NB-ARC domain-containing protein n=1 Tax=Fagus sylvatica TaxID=28930 RepID=A0A2N9H875_FAGSY
MTELAFSVAEKVIEKLGSPAYKEICLAWNIAGDLEKLQDIMSTVQAVLLDAEEKQAKNRQIYGGKWWKDMETLAKKVGIGGLGKTTLAQWVYNDERDPIKWNALKILLIDGVKGSKIVVTTRSHNVAKVMATEHIHDLKGLPEDVCLSLFLRWAFNKGEEEKHPKLVEIGKQIVKKCSGVPLAVRTLGSLLYSKTEEQHIKKLPNSICDLQNLETLLLDGCDELEELPRDIRKMCPGLESFPEGIQRLTALRRLDFTRCESLISLPQVLMRLDDCENLAALPEWLPNLTSLQKLQIGGCRKLSSLPEGMGRLTALRELEIDNCGELSKNCEREVGVEWPKIKHIPQIGIW